MSSCLFISDTSSFRALVLYFFGRMTVLHRAVTRRLHQFATPRKKPFPLLPEIKSDRYDKSLPSKLIEAKNPMQIEEL